MSGNPNRIDAAEHGCVTTFIIKRRRFTKRSTCRHEAGHCVVAFALNFRRIIDCEVWKKRSQWEGCVTFESSEDIPLTAEVALKGLRVVIAGILLIGISINQD